MTCRSHLLVFSVALGFALLAACTITHNDAASSVPTKETVHRTSIASHLPTILGEVRVVAVGDVMMHADVVQSSLNHVDGYESLWADVAPLFKDADVVFGNLETPVAPDTGKQAKSYMFNAPASLPAALKAAGWTIFSTANNHSFDQGINGVKETVSRLNDAQLITLGSGENRSSAEQTRIIERNGVKVAFIGFTDIFNIDLDNKVDQPWVRKLELEPALASIKAARQVADAVVISIHWGDEYHHQPNQRQQQIATALIRGGADVVLGHHPHVLQPAEIIDAVDEQGNKRVGLVIYSLGNFISNQDRQYRADLFPIAAGDNRDEIALQFTLSKVRRPDGHADIILGEVAYEPLWVENNWNAAHADKSIKRDIHIIRIRAAIEKTWQELDELTDPVAGPRLIADDKQRRRKIVDKQEYLRTLLLRKARIASIVGSAFEAQ